MSLRRPLGETLGEIAGAALALGDNVARMVSVTSIELDLPIELRFGADAAGPVLVGDVPLFRTRTDFDWPPARLVAQFHAEPLEAQP